MPDAKPVTLEATIAARVPGMRLGFEFMHQDKRIYCFDASGIDGFDQLRPGQLVRITGQWSRAVIGIFEAEEIQRL